MMVNNGYKQKVYLESGYDFCDFFILVKIADIPVEQIPSFVTNYNRASSYSYFLLGPGSGIITFYRNLEEVKNDISHLEYLGEL